MPRLSSSCISQIISRRFSAYCHHRRSDSYSGVAARIARVHQFGERDQVAPGIFTDYPVRELLGISQADERLIYNTVLGRIAEAVR